MSLTSQIVPKPRTDLKETLDVFREQKSELAASIGALEKDPVIRDLLEAHSLARLGSAFWIELPNTHFIYIAQGDGKIEVQFQTSGRGETPNAETAEDLIDSVIKSSAEGGPATVTRIKDMIQSGLESLGEQISSKLDSAAKA